MRNRVTCVLAILLLGAFSSYLISATPVAARAITNAKLIKLVSGQAKAGAIKHAGKPIKYSFTAVTGQHVTLAITSPKVAPTGDSLQMNVYDASNLDECGPTYFNTTPQECDFTPTSTEAGKTTVVISPNQTGSTGKFTLTYSTDVIGTLTSGVATNGTLSYGGQHADYTFTAVTGEHVTLAITNPVVSPPGDSLQINVYDANNLDECGPTYFNTTPQECDFTPTSTEAGPTTVVISPNQYESTGKFTLTYATDVIGTLSSGVATNGTLSYGGQHADYTFTAVAGEHVTLAITNPVVSPSGDSLQINVYDANNLDECGPTYFNTTPQECDFTPTPTEAGTTTVVISPNQYESTGSFTLTYATDVIGTLSSGVATNGTLSYGGQHADYTFTAVAGQSITLAITNPVVSPSGDSLQMNVYDSNGLNVCGPTYFNTSPEECIFTPTPTEAGTTTVVISPNQYESTGSFTLTYTG